LHQITKESVKISAQTIFVKENFLIIKFIRFIPRNSRDVDFLF